MEVALESTVITHGLPAPLNERVALNLIKLAKNNGCIAKVIAIIAGEIKIGLSKKEIAQLAQRNDVLKIGTREIPIAVAKKAWASTTVSATMRIANIRGLKVFATGGIGGVHGGDWDVSQDILELSQTRMIVVSAGPKSILDLKATFEFLESFQVTVVAFKTDEMPAFYLKKSGIRITPVNSVQEVVEIYKEKERLNLPGAVLVFNPLPEKWAIDNDEYQLWYNEALKELKNKRISGKDVTPFLLSKLAALSSGKTLEANIKLLENNVILACQIAKECCEQKLV